MEAGVARQAAELLGADLEIESGQPFSGEAEAVFDSLGGRQARQVETHSMVLLPASGGSRLVEVRALEGEWPFYGRVRTDPPGAWAVLGAGGGALVDDGVMRQFDAQVGDSVQVGRRRFRIAGRVLSVPGETAVRSDVRPPVFIPLEHLDETGLVRYGSRVEHKRYFAFDDGRPAGGLAGGVEERLRLSDPGLDADTAADRQRRLGRTIRNLDAFLGLGGFIALLLGAVGVASAIHAHVEQKLETVAVLRALGASSRQALAVYLLQAGAMGLAGSVAGALAGLGVMLLLPQVVAGFLPGAVDDRPVAAAPARGRGDRHRHRRAVRGPAAAGRARRQPPPRPARLVRDRHPRRRPPAAAAGAGRGRRRRLRGGAAAGRAGGPRPDVHRRHRRRPAAAGGGRPRPARRHAPVLPAALELRLAPGPGQPPSAPQPDPAAARQPRSGRLPGRRPAHRPELDPLPPGPPRRRRSAEHGALRHPDRSARGGGRTRRGAGHAGAAAGAGGGHAPGRGQGAQRRRDRR